MDSGENGQEGRRVDGNGGQLLKDRIISRQQGKKNGRYLKDGGHLADKTRMDCRRVTDEHDHKKAQ